MCIILAGAGSGDFVIRAAKLTETTPYSLAKDMQMNYVARLLSLHTLTIEFLKWSTYNYAFAIPIKYTNPSALK